MKPIKFIITGIVAAISVIFISIMIFKWVAFICPARKWAPYSFNTISLYREYQNRFYKTDTFSLASTIYHEKEQYESYPILEEFNAKPSQVVNDIDLHHTINWYYKSDGSDFIFIGIIEKFYIKGKRSAYKITPKGIYWCDFCVQMNASAREVDPSVINYLIASYLEPSERPSFGAMLSKTQFPECKVEEFCLFP